MSRRVGRGGDRRSRSLPAGTRGHRLSRQADRCPASSTRTSTIAQTDIIASYGAQLLEWLERYTFPAEAPVRAIRRTRAKSPSSSSPSCCATARRRRWCSRRCTGSRSTRSSRRRAGARCAIDRRQGADGSQRARSAVRDTAESGYEDSEGADRARGTAATGSSYAVTPRFAPTSTERQLELCGPPAGRASRRVPADRTSRRIAARSRGWPSSSRGAAAISTSTTTTALLRERAVYAHCIHLDDDGPAADGGHRRRDVVLRDVEPVPRQRTLRPRGGARGRRARGPRHRRRRRHHVLDAAHAGRVVQGRQLAGQSLSPLPAFYLATLGGARALYLDDRIGNFMPGKEADFVVLDPAATPLLARRMQAAPTLQDKLFALMMLGDDRAVAAT